MTIRDDIPLEFQLLSSRETATILRIGMEALATLRDTGQLPCVPMERGKEGKEKVKQPSRKKAHSNQTPSHFCYRYRASTVQAFIAGGEVTLKVSVE